MDRFNDALKRNTWMVILVGIIFSVAFPNYGLAINPYLNYLLGVILFLSCLDLNIKEILTTLSDVKAQSLSLLVIHLASPLIIYFLRGYFSPEIYLGLILASAIPSGRSAVFLSKIYGGKPIKALTVSTISNSLAPITVPALVWIFAHTTLQIDAVKIGSTIFYMVIIPFSLALLVARTKPGKALNRVSTSISTIMLFLIILGIISPIEPIITNHPVLTLALILIVSVLVIVDFFLGTLLKRDQADKVTYGLICSYKNYTLSTLLSLTLFSPMVALPSVAYTIVNNLLLIPLQFFANRKVTTTKTI
jgi:BASS family bile acid:Na+ symporter